MMTSVYYHYRTLFEFYFLLKFCYREGSGTNVTIYVTNESGQSMLVVVVYDRIMICKPGSHLG